MPELLTLRRLIPGVLLLLVTAACAPDPGPAAGEAAPASDPEITLPEPDPVSVTPVLEEEAAVSATLDAEGGTLEATGPGGTRLVLEVPPGVLFTEVEITLTPARAVEGLPLSGDLVGAVDLAPDGLVLLRPATLVIESPDLPAEVLAFGWLGDGDDFHLKVFEAEDGRVEIPVTHFSGAGAGGGTSADAERAASHPPADLDAAYEHAMAACRASGGGSDCTEALGEYALAEYHGRVKPMLEAAIRDENQPFRDGIAAWLAWANRMQLVFGDEATLFDEFVESEDLAAEAFDHAYRRAKERCVADHEPAQGLVILQLDAALQLLGWGGASGLEDAERCMRFKLDFRNEVDITSGEGEIRDEVLARNVPITFEGGETRTLEVEGIGPVWIFGGAGSLTWGGSGEIVVIEVERDYYGDDVQPEFRPSEPGLFVVDSLTWFGGRSPTNAWSPWEEEFAVELAYDPGRPDATLTVDGSSISLNHVEIGWRVFYDILHQEDVDGLGRYLLADWEPGKGQDLFARADVDRSFTEDPVSGTSTSTFELWHDPDPNLAREG